MEISPGVELVWSLASREAMLAKVREVEPDHFFCALLKYAEFSNSELEGLKVHSLVLFALIAERDQLKSGLRRNNLQTDLRKQIRARLERGDYQAKQDEILHRSEAARQLFVKAAERGRDGTNAPTRTDVSSLLHVLLEHPTPVMAEVLGVPAIQAVVAPQERGDSVLNQYAQEFSQPDAALGKKTAPQVQVLAWAIQSLAKNPVMLICESETDVQSLIWAAVQKQHTPPGVLMVDLDQIRQDAKGKDAFASQVSGILEETSDRPSQFLLLDAVKLTDLITLFDAIQSNLSKKNSNLILVVSPEAYAKAKEKNVSVDNPYRMIWLHDLEKASLPTRV